MLFLEQTQTLLRRAPRTLTLTKIAKETGLSVSWLSDFATDKLKDYGVKKVQLLHQYLNICEPFGDRVTFEDLYKYNKHERRNCVYFIYADDILLYIGKSATIYNRLLQHHISGKFKDYNPTHIDLVWFVDNDKPGEDSSKAYKYEAFCINQMQPLLNLRSMANKSIVSREG